MPRRVTQTVTELFPKTADKPIESTILSPRHVPGTTTPAPPMNHTRPRLSAHERSLLAGDAGDATQLAMRIVVRMGEILGAGNWSRSPRRTSTAASTTADGGVEFAERLVRMGGAVAVPATLNVGALDLLNPGRVRASERRREMALRLMRAYQALGCTPTWTCAPYQAGHRPATGEHVAWGESNAVAFANSVLGPARTATATSWTSAAR